jgi:hypothetical protein
VLNRTVGVVTLRAPTFREIADDRTATGQAAFVVIVVSLIVGFVAGYLEASAGGVGIVQTAIVGALNQLLAALIAWAFGAWLTAFVAKVIFHGRTNTLEMLRLLGFTWIFRIVGIIPVVGLPIGVVLSIIGNTIGIQTVAGLDSSRAILTSLVSGVVIGIIIVGGMMAGKLPL